jgi:hypothetical protein
MIFDQNKFASNQATNTYHKVKQMPSKRNSPNTEFRNVTMIGRNLALNSAVTSSPTGSPSTVASATHSQGRRIIVYDGKKSSLIIT